MTHELHKAYEPQEIERRWAERWVESKVYTPEVAARLRPPDPAAPTFCIVIPPPNVTGSIHIGHMLEHTQIDVLTRWHRMRGFRTLWLPGMDHAGIATQVVVERELAREGRTREQLGREEFERRVWDWKAHSGGAIKRQMIRLGASCDWTRERFTLDPPLYAAVLESFLRLFRDGLIYRGRYIINWCPRCLTALSDLEVRHAEKSGHLWFFRYPLADGSGHVTVATTRPETMLGDTAVAVHPADERYAALVGRKVILPLMEREIPVIADAAVDREFGTGAVKVTPAHDPNDFEMARRHALPEVDVMDSAARMNASAGRYAGLDRFAAREQIVADMRAAGLLEKTAHHALAVGACDRCKTVVEPRVSTQWFCRMKPLAEEAIAAVQEGLIPIVPENRRAEYFEWMRNIRDWCISRQLWWGHRIPVWHCADCGAMSPAADSRVEIVNGRAQAASAPARCSACSSANIAQDSDVLDTWFSSALWPFSTLGWPDREAHAKFYAGLGTDTRGDLDSFYPTSLLISGYDILFFWDARMIMMGLRLLRDLRPARADRVPFRALYLHSLVRDPEGQKMSKTRGNVVDPLHIIEQHGTDALRFTLAILAAPGTDIALSEDRILSYRAFANKIWNAARFIFLNLSKAQQRGIALEEVAAPEVRERAPYAHGDSLALMDRWIFSRLARTVAEVNAALAEYRFHEAAHQVYHFFWGDFCDWYIEWVKPGLAAEDRAGAQAAWRNLFAVFDAALRLLHPFMPFLTEELWHRLPQRAGAASISLEAFPDFGAEFADAQAEREVELLQEIIVAARNARADLKLDPRRKVPAELFSSQPETVALVDEHLQAVLRLAGLSALRAAHGSLPSAGGTVRSTAHFDLRLEHAEGVDSAAESARLQKEIERLSKDIAAKRARLADESFRSRAPEKIVRDLEATLQSRIVEHRKLSDMLEHISRGSS
jgi:valyl-tRNA synthetase